MDSQLEELYGSLQGINFKERAGQTLSSQNFFDAMKLADSNLNYNYVDPTLLTPGPNDGEEVPSVGERIGNNQADDFDFSDVILKYINQVLMEEDVEEKVGVYGPSALEATEKSLYEAIGEKYPSPQNYDIESVRNSRFNRNDVEDSNSSSSSGNSVRNCLVVDFPTSPEPLIQASYGSSTSSVEVDDLSPSDSHSWSSNASGAADGLVDSAMSALRVSNMFNEESMFQFKKGAEEACKLLDISSLESVGASAQKSRFIATDLTAKLEKSVKIEQSDEVSRGKKHRHPDLLLPVEGRGSKQFAVSNETAERTELFDMVLLCSNGKNDAALREALRSGMNKTIQDVQSKGLSGGKGRGKKQGSKRDLVDLRSLLSLCAQAVASSDQRSAYEILRQVRQNSSPDGDGNQRMAHYFAEGLEARLAGVGTPMYTFVVNGLGSAADILRAYHLFLAICPFKKLSNFVANRTIMQVGEKAKKIHIIDFGILYGFQWPCLIQRLSKRTDGAPKLKITGIDLPQPGFRPAKRVEETGRRLKNYAESFNVPFEFNPVAKKWETVSVEDLKIEEDEVLVVNSMYRFKYLFDETVMVDSPRNRVLNLIRKINPTVFIQGIVNGAYNAPFFMTRFREALFHFSTMFDMLEVNVPRETNETMLIQRMLIEKEIFGRQAVNAIACEGFDRIERPETYKQWHARNERAGFKEVPIKRQIVSMAKERVKSCYHRDFVIDEDGHWLLQGWKGRILYALSCWKPAH